MANPRAERDAEASVYETARQTAEQTSRTGRMMAGVGERAFQAQTEMLQRNVEALQQLMQHWNEFASRLTGKSADQVAKAFGVGGNEAEHAVEQSTHTLNAVVQSSAALNQNMHEVSRQWLELLQRQVERGMNHMDALLRARTPQELAAVQCDIMRDHLDGIIDTTKRAAELSSEAANKASKHMSEVAEATRGAA